MKQPAKLVVIGLGQELRGDDAVGIEIVRLWQAKHPHTYDAAMRVELSPLPGLELLDLLEGAQAAVLVDAVQGPHPGTVHVVDRHQLASFGCDAASAHGWGAAETLELAAQVDSDILPSQILFLLIEAATVELGVPMSQAVRDSLPAAVEELQLLALQMLDLPQMAEPALTN
jgi:hydrogenase maturation protease